MKPSAKDLAHYSVTQSNRLIEASYSLTLDEKRLLIAAISKINPLEAGTGVVEVTAEEFAQLFSIHTKNAYQQLKSAMNRLFDRRIALQEYDQNGNLAEVELRWLYQKTAHSYSRGMVTLNFSPTLMPYLFQLKEQYSTYKVLGMRTLASFLSIRLYELLTQYDVVGSRWITPDAFRKHMGLMDKYPQFKDLKKMVIDPAVREIMEKTDYVVSYELEKNGRSISKIWFFFTKKPQLQMDL